MATPGFTHHLSDLLAQLHRLSGLMGDPLPIVPEALPSMPVVWSNPRRCIETAGWRVSDYAFFHHVDVLRPYSLPMPMLMVDEVTLTSLIVDLMKSAIEASANKGAVVCHLHQDQRGLRICICDSSGHSPKHILQLEENSRLRIFKQAAIEVDALGGVLIVACHPDEGVVVEILFPPECLVRPAAFLPAPLSANDDRRGRHQKI